MAKSDRFAFRIQFLLEGFGIFLLCSCSTPAIKNSGTSPFVNKVDFSLAPYGQDLADRARKTCNRLYPEVCALLTDGDLQFPPQFDVYLKKDLRSGNLAEARMTRICLNAKYLDQFANDPSHLDNVLVHEMAHVAQRYYGRIIGKWLVYNPRPPNYWVEGIADYVCFKLGQTNAWRCAECSPPYPHYRNGYSCAGAFLLFLEKNYNPEIVPKLNKALRHGRYTDLFFAKNTTKDLPSLWAEFQTTPAFTPGAARMLDLHEQLGFLNGKPPKDIDERLKRYEEEHIDPSARRLMHQAEVPGLKTADVRWRLSIMHFFTQPGGTAEAYIVGLQENEALPGFGKGEQGTISGSLSQRDFNETFPTLREFTATKNGDNSTYHYLVFRASVESSWTLQRAWRIDPDGKIAEEYPVP